MAKEKAKAAPETAGRPRRFWLRRAGMRFWIENKAAHELLDVTEQGEPVTTDTGHEDEASARARFEVLKAHYKGNPITLEVK